MLSSSDYSTNIHSQVPEMSTNQLHNPGLRNHSLLKQSFRRIENETKLQVYQ